MTDKNMPSVTQADIDAAYDIISAGAGNAVRACMMAASHREQSTAELRAENERLIEANRLRMNETHKERAEASLWFDKAQEWRAENGRLRELLEGACKGIEDGRLYDAMCCSGHACGCRGSSNADLLCHDLRAALYTINAETNHE